LTLRRKYGDCKDKTALFVDLARIAGLEAYPVLTSSDRRSTRKLLLPATHYFDHMVACVRIQGDIEHCVDLTDPYSHYTLSSDALQGAIRLDVKIGTSAVDVFKTTPYYRVKDVRATNTIRSDGSLVEEQVVTYAGPLAARVRAFLISKTPQERQESELADYHSLVSDSVNPEFEFFGLNDVSDPVTTRSNVLYKAVFEPGKFGSYTEKDGWLANELKIAKSKNKHHEYAFSGIRYRSEFISKLPTGYSVAYTGPKLSLKTRFGSLIRQYEIEGPGYRVITELNLPRAKIPLSDLPKFNRFLDYLKDNVNMWVALAQPSDKQE
jgi:hypothetical protein